jgi:protein O-GlcNAc transferase
VPVVTLVGKTIVGRAGLSQLSNLGMSQRIASTSAEFVMIATNLAEDLVALAALRPSIRTNVEQSPLMDARGFARGVEQAYRTMWQTWCSAAR